MKKLIVLSFLLTNVLATTDIVAMESLSLKKIQDHFFKKNNEKIVKIIKESNIPSGNDPRTKLFENFADRLFVHYDFSPKCYNKLDKLSDLSPHGHKASFYDRKDNLPWTINPDKSLSVPHISKVISIDYKASSIVHKSIPGTRIFKNNQYYKAEFSIGEIKKKGENLKSKTPFYLLSALYTNDKKEDDGEKTWAFQPAFSFEQIALYLALQKQYRENKKKAVSIGNYPHAYSILCSLPKKNQNKLVEFGWITLPVIKLSITKRLTNWAKANPFLTTAIGTGITLGGAGLVFGGKKIIELSKGKKGN